MGGQVLEEHVSGNVSKGLIGFSHELGGGFQFLAEGGRGGLEGSA